MGPLTLLSLALLVGVVVLVRKRQREAREHLLREATWNERAKTFQRNRAAHKLARERLAAFHARGVKPAA